MRFVHIQAARDEAAKQRAAAREVESALRAELLGARLAAEQQQVRNTKLLFGGHFSFKTHTKDHFYQDRLGTHIGTKTQNKATPFSRSARWPVSWPTRRSRSRSGRRRSTTLMIR